MVLIAVVIIGALYLWWNRPTSPEIERSEAVMCRMYYKAAGTAKDSARVENGYWVVQHSWRRTPTCGELLHQGKL